MWHPLFSEVLSPLHHVPDFIFLHLVIIWLAIIFILLLLTGYHRFVGLIQLAVSVAHEIGE